MAQNSINAEENPIFGSINVNPLEPTPLSEVNFIIGVNKNVTVDEVRLIAEECTGDMCFFKGFNVSMNYTYSCCWAFYETQIKLLHEDATKIKYCVIVLSNGTWYNSIYSSTNLSIPFYNNSTINPESRSTSGFEFVLIFFSAGLLLIRRCYKLKEKNN